MPVEVRELRITAEVSEQSESQSSAPMSSNAISAIEQEKFIRTCVERCVEQVFEVLKRNNQK